VQANSFVLWISLLVRGAGLRPFVNFTLSQFKLVRRWIIALRPTFAMSDVSETLAATYGQNGYVTPGLFDRDSPG
jgi:hypothetical protein